MAKAIGRLASLGTLAFLSALAPRATSANAL